MISLLNILNYTQVCSVSGCPPPFLTSFSEELLLLELLLRPLDLPLRLESPLDRLLEKLREELADLDRERPLRLRLHSNAL